MTRAATWIARPETSSPRCSTSPTCSPIRTDRSSPGEPRSDGDARRTVPARRRAGRRGRRHRWSSPRCRRTGRPRRGSRRRGDRAGCASGRRRGAPTSPVEPTRSVNSTAASVTGGLGDPPLAGDEPGDRAEQVVDVLAEPVVVRRRRGRPVARGGSPWPPGSGGVGLPTWLAGRRRTRVGTAMSGWASRSRSSSSTGGRS